MPDVMEALREMMQEEIQKALAPLMNTLGALGSLGGSIARLPARGRPGRKPGRPSSNGKPCGVDGCPNDARSKGYCAAHYQKFRNMVKDHPAEAKRDGWTDNPKPRSVTNTILPRGRAAADAKKGKKAA